MKKAILTIASILISGILIAQDYTPSNNVTTSFTNKYPSGIVDEWVDNENEILCYFEDNGNYGNARFTLKGVWINSEFSMIEDDLPANILSSIREEYKGFETIDVTKREDIKQVVYVLSIYNEASEQDLLITIDTNGKIVKEEELNADE